METGEYQERSHDPDENCAFCGKLPIYGYGHDHWYFKGYIIPICVRCYDYMNWHGVFKAHSAREVVERTWW